MPLADQASADDISPHALADMHRELMARLGEARDREAFQSLYAYFGPRIKAMMLKAGAQHDLAEDIVQEVMMTVWHKVHLYAPDRGTVAAWVFTIARNARIDRLRRGASKPYQDIAEIEIASDDDNGEDGVVASQRAIAVAEALAELPDEQREIMDYAFARDLPQSEIAAQLGLPLGTVKSRMRLAYGKLKGRLEAFR